jgi:Uma2 family endonuclease
MLQAASRRIFQPGTTGWSVDDLQDQAIRREWSEGRHEMVDGVLTEMAPQGFQGIEPLHTLRRIIERRADKLGIALQCYTEVDLQLRPRRVARPDLVLLTGQELQAQKREARRRRLTRTDYQPLFVVPSLIVESVSVGGEEHDRETKREWYAEARVPRYWILTAFERSLVCLRLEKDLYLIEAQGRGKQTVQTSLLDGMAIKLGELW